MKYILIVYLFDIIDVTTINIYFSTMILIKVREICHEIEVKMTTTAGLCLVL